MFIPLGMRTNSSLTLSSIWLPFLGLRLRKLHLPATALMMLKLHDPSTSRILMQSPRTKPHESFSKQDNFLHKELPTFTFTNSLFMVAFCFSSSSILREKEYVNDMVENVALASFSRWKHLGLFGSRRSWVAISLKV